MHVVETDSQTDMRYVCGDHPCVEVNLFAERLARSSDNAECFWI